MLVIILIIFVLYFLLVLDPCICALPINGRLGSVGCEVSSSSHRSQKVLLLDTPTDVVMSGTISADPDPDPDDIRLYIEPQRVDGE